LIDLCSGELRVGPTTRIFSGRNRFEVLDVDARPLAAQVVDRKALRDRTTNDLVGHPVYIGELASRAHECVTAWC